MLNIEDFASPVSILHIPLEAVGMAGPQHAVDVAAMTVQWLFFDGKMRALFATLFGAGTVLLLERIARRRGDGTAADIFHRRNMWLMVFGLMHGALIWDGDVLLTYGSLALLALYPLRHVAARRLIGVGLAVSVVGGTAGFANALHIPAAIPSAMLQEGARAARLAHRPPTAEQAKGVVDAVAMRKAAIDALPKRIADGRRSYLQMLPSNRETEARYVSLYFSTGYVCEVLGLMILGMGLYKTGFLSARLSSRTYVAVAAVGYAISVPIVLVGLHHASLFGFSDAVTKLWLLLPYMAEEVACMLANASLVLLVVKHGRVRPVQAGLAAVGRTAFSNYILTSLLCQFLFAWGPWKLYGTLEYYQNLYVVAGVWAINIAASLVWLKFFAFGPLEWAWRSLTYWQRQPFRVGPTGGRMM